MELHRLQPTPAAPLVCFTGRSEIAWLRWLRPGFRHCFCLLPADAAGRAWLLVDARCNRLDVRLLNNADRASVVRHFRRAGYRVVEAPRLPDPAPWPALVPGPYSCVEAVKRAIGLAAPLTLTPYALYRRLRKMSQVEKKMLTFGSSHGIQASERTRSASAARGPRAATAHGPGGRGQG
jgi:hypothetical protein